jgi:GAF domain-containing protein/sugar diacid utilization regulator
LTTVTPAEMSAVVAEEAERVLGTTQAVVWLCPPGRNQLLRLQPSASQLLAVPPGFTFPSTPASWEPNSPGFEGEVIAASFDSGASLGGAVLAVPLRASGQTWALLICRYASAAMAHQALEHTAVFAEQAGAIVANCAALEAVHRQRERLGALYDTVRELSSNLEPDVVWRAIVNRARSLIPTPASFLALIDKPAGQVHVPVAVGFRRGADQSIRFDVGEGLFGLVAREGRPVCTNDYPADPALRAHLVVHAEVAGEKFRSILGVPVRLEREIAGALFVASRESVMFTAEDAEVLASLADHAAIVMRNADLFEQERRAVAKLQEANERVAHQNRRLSHAERVHVQLSQLILSGGDVAAIARLLAGLACRSVSVVDANLRLVAADGDIPDEFERELRDRRQLPGAVQTDQPFAGAAWQRAAGGPGRWQPPQPAGSAPRLVTPIVAVGDVLGYLLVVGGKDASDPDELEIEVVEGVRTLALVMLQVRSVAEAEARFRGEFLAGLLSDRPPTLENLLSRGSLVGVDLTARYRVVVCRVDDAGPAGRRPPSPQHTGLETLASELRRTVPGSFAAETRGLVVWLVPDEPDTGAGQVGTTTEVRQCLDRVGAGAAFTAVVSAACTSVPDYRHQFLAAEKALQLLAEVGRLGTVWDLEDLGSLALLLDEQKRADIERTINRLLGSLLEYDRQHDSRLTETLDAYFAFLGNVAKVANACHLHVNSVYYRLERIRSLLGADFDEPPRAFELHFALRARRLLSSEDRGA